MRMLAESNGEGDLTVGQFADFLQGFPDNARLNIHTDEDQRDGKLWRVRVTWDAEVEGVGSMNLRGKKKEKSNTSHFVDASRSADGPLDHR